MSRTFFAFAVIVGLGLATAAHADAERQALRAELARLDTVPEPSASGIIDGESLRPGDTSDAVLQVRRALAAFGFEALPPPDHSFFDDLMVEEVRAFQAAVGLFPDGVVGNETRKALRFMDADRRDRLRQTLAQPPLPSTGRYMVVNLASGLLYAVEDGQKMLTSRVIVGAKSTPTPIFSTRITAVWLNPSWRVPASILVKEFGGNPHTEKPGPSNPLGQVLLEMANPYEVFLHSTNAPQFFDHDRRAFSHGCVRVAEIRALAHWLLGDAAWSAESVDTMLAGYTTKEIPLGAEVPVYLQYRTASVGPGGAVIYHPDPYGLAAPFVPQLVVADTQHRVDADPVLRVSAPN